MPKFVARNFKQIGCHLRCLREDRGLTLPFVAGSCGLGVLELIRIENGDLLEFSRVNEGLIKSARIYAQALDVKLEELAVNSPPSEESRIKSKPFIPAFLRKK